MLQLYRIILIHLICCVVDILSKVLSKPVLWSIFFLSGIDSRNSFVSELQLGINSGFVKFIPGNKYTKDKAESWSHDGLESNHRIVEWSGLEGTFKIIWFQPPCHEQGCLPLSQVAQSSIQPGLEHFQGWGSHNKARLVCRKMRCVA